MSAVTILDRWPTSSPISAQPDAVNLGKDRTNLRLIDGEELVDLIFDNYESFSPEFKRKIPMRRR